MRHETAWFLESRRHPGLLLARQEFLTQRRQGRAKRGLVLADDSDNCMAFATEKDAMRWLLDNARSERTRDLRVVKREHWAS